VLVHLLGRHSVILRHALVARQVNVLGLLYS